MFEGRSSKLEARRISKKKARGKNGTKKGRKDEYDSQEAILVEFAVFSNNVGARLQSLKK